MSTDDKNIDQGGAEDKGVATQDQLDAITKQLADAMEIVNAQKDSIDKLSTNNKALLDEKAEEVAKLDKVRLDKLASDGDHKTILDEERSKWDADRKSMQTKVDTLSKQFHGVTGDGVLNATLDSVGINPAMKSVVASKFRSEWAFSDEGSVMHNGMPMADSIKDWSKTDEGKAFLVSDNSGSGAKPSAKNESPQMDVSKMTEDQLIEAAENGTLPDSGNVWE